MKKLVRWLSVSMMAVIAVGSAGSVLSQSMVAITSTSQTVELTGTSGGTRKASSCAGYVSSSPNHVVQVAEDTNLQITLNASGGQPSLMIRNPAGQEFCVPADSYSGGKISIPGRWTKGNYAIYVGDRQNEHYSYTLSIAKN